MRFGICSRFLSGRPSARVGRAPVAKRRVMAVRGLGHGFFDGLEGPRGMAEVEPGPILEHALAVGDKNWFSLPILLAPR